MLQLTARSHHCSCWALCRCARTLGAGQNLQDKEFTACGGSHGAPCSTTHLLGLLAHLLPLPSLLRGREFSRPSRALSSPLAPAPASLGEAAGKERDESQDIYPSPRQDLGPHVSRCTGTSGFYLHLPVQGHRGIGWVAGTGSGGADVCPGAAGAQSCCNGSIGWVGCSLLLVPDLAPAWASGMPGRQHRSPG